MTPIIDFFFGGQGSIMRGTIIFGMLLLVTMSGTATAATDDTTYTIRELTKQANIVFTGTVDDSRSEWNEDNTQIYTYVTFSVDELIKGVAPSKKVTIKQLGGTMGDITLYIVGAPGFEKGEEVLLFANDELIPVVGMSQGKFVIETEPATGRKMVVGQKVYLDSFVNKAKTVNIEVEKGVESTLGSEVLISGTKLKSTSTDDFRIYGPNFDLAGDYISKMRPSDNPPFVHWDLREFPDCEVPWSISNNVPDLNENGIRDVEDLNAAFGAISDSFKTWEAVEPAALGFVETPKGVVERAIMMDGYNVLDWGTGGGDDIQTHNFSTTPGANVVAITAGPNRFLETQPRGDDQIVGNTITSGQNGTVETNASNQGSIGKGEALTGLFFNNKNGVIIEADILFHPEDTSHNWTIGTENPGLGMYDIQVTATHEIGHFIGIAHTPNTVTGDVPTMNGSHWPPNLTKATLESSDKNAINFLYTPDLGDAPDPYIGSFNYYPSLVHSTNKGRTLNGVQLFIPAQGAEHLFGYQPAGYAYEWLGSVVEKEGDKPECEAKLVPEDEHDDGVKIIEGTLVPGDKIKIQVDVNIKNDGLHTGNRYLNAWIDWNNDGDWLDDGEKVIGTDVTAETVNPPGTQIFTETKKRDYTITVPAHFKQNEWSWARFRLDYEEDSASATKIDTTLKQEKGAAQFGEVEDYKLCSITTLPAIESSDEAKNIKDIFSDGEKVYVKGIELKDDDAGDIYVFPNADWKDGDDISTGFLSEIINATAQNGDFVDSPLELGIVKNEIPSQYRQFPYYNKYDIVYDINQNQIYDADVDLIDKVNCIGFETIPEFTTIAIPFASIMALVFIFSRGRKKE